MDFREYDALLRTGGIQPNFFIADAYLSAQGWPILTEDKRVCVRDEEGQLAFPPVSSVGGFLVNADEPVRVDFEGYDPPALTPEFFDYEFIYRADAFRDLGGGRFRTFRKNTRNFMKKNPDWKYRLVDGAAAAELFVLWLQESQVEIAEEPSVIVRYLLNNPVWGLLVYGKLVGFNAWDGNYRFTNYRYGFGLRSEPYSSELLRRVFYERLPAGTLVNDGGTLGSAGLERFKRKLNPHWVLERRSWGMDADARGD